MFESMRTFRFLLGTDPGRSPVQLMRWVCGRGAPVVYVSLFYYFVIIDSNEIP